MGILSNNNGDILRANQSGSVIKQNYNFGNEFIIANKVYIPEQDLTNYTIFMWVSDINSYVIHLEHTNGNVYIGNNGNRIYLGNETLGVSNTVLSGAYMSNDDMFIGFHFLDDKIKCYINGHYLSNSSTTYILLQGLIAFRLCYGYTNAKAGRVGEIILYNNFNHDFISCCNYMYNNGLGNEPLYSDYSIRSTFNEAELLDFDGEQMVGIRNHAGENHLLLKDLPAGTLQEQLDYANANLFEQW